MRTVLHSQLTLSEEDIARIQLDPKSRDDIPRLLAGMNHPAASSGEYDPE